MRSLRFEKQNWSPFIKWGTALFILILLTIAVRSVLGQIIYGFDYLRYWDAGRALVIDHINPYGSEVALRIHFAAYHTLPETGKYPVPFIYPLYLIFPTLPLSFLSFDWSQSFWMVLNILLPISIGSLYLIKVPKWQAISFLFFYPMWFTVILGNIALPIGLLLIAIIYSLIFNKPANLRNWADVFLGAALAWGTGKPQMVYLFVALILFISYRDGRVNILKGFISGFVLQNCIAILFKPDWLWTWLQTARNYPQYEPSTPVISTYLRFLFPKAEILILTGFAVLVFLITSIWLVRAWRQAAISDLALFAWAAFLQYLFDPASKTPDQIIFLVPFFIWVFSRGKSFKVKLFWFGGILLSNLLFVMVRNGILNQATEVLPPLFYAAWLLYFLVEEKREEKGRLAAAAVSG